MIVVSDTSVITSLIHIGHLQPVFSEDRHPFLGVESLRVQIAVNWN
jgi:hypothetical protein